MVETALPVATTGPDRVRHPARGYVYLVVAAALFAVNGTVSKVILDTGVTAMRLTELRCAGAMVGLGLLLLFVVAPEAATASPGASCRCSPPSASSGWRPPRGSTSSPSRGCR